MEYLLVCRSITFAKQTKAVLDNNRIPSKIVRTPVGVVSESCGYSVKVSENDHNTALLVLKQNNLIPKRIIVHYFDGRYVEASI